MSATKRPSTLGALKASGYQSRSIKDELRHNLITALRDGKRVFEGVLGFDDTVIPDIERAILSRHNVLLLGLRGQAKTRIARQMTELLDEYVPVVAGSELNDDPLNPLSRQARDTIAEMGDDTLIEWVHRDERYVEKLATPDVSVADLIGDVDPIKAATLKLPYSDERVIHFGLIPRSHRSIFVINELPDLQARIQVSLFNILQEGDIQIRGFKMRLPLDILFVFTANPEDYTNRGSIITPLKDRIESQILTHYPQTIDIAKSITAQEADIARDQDGKIKVPELMKDLLEMISFKARESEYVDEKSGVSARMSITAMENLYSSAERRMLLNGESETTVRISDFWGIIPAITGKVELVYEGEQEGSYAVALNLLGQAIQERFLEIFPHPERIKKSMERDPYGVIRAFFSGSNVVEINHDASDEEYHATLDGVPGLADLVKSTALPDDECYAYKELALHALAEFEVISKDLLQQRISFSDPLADMLDDLNDEDLN
ncbi:MAG: magnesium chelatase [Saprospiraceae bacterium]|nr:magnesium chelatase [Saprospiraceae bacterium]